MQQLLVPRRCFSVNIMSKVTFNSLCLLWKQRTYGRKRMMNFWERGEFLLQDFPRDTSSGIHLTSREFVSIDPCKHFTTLDRKQLLTAPSPRMATHRHGKYIRNTSNTLWRKIDTCRTGRKTEKEIERERKREKESRATTLSLSVIGGRDLLYWIHGEFYLYRNDEGERKRRWRDEGN